MNTTGVLAAILVKAGAEVGLTREEMSAVLDSLLGGEAAAPQPSLPPSTDSSTPLEGEAPLEGPAPSEGGLPPF